MTRTTPTALLPFIAAAAGLLALAGCVTAPLAPTAALQAASDAIGNAEQARAAEHAATDLAQARTELAAANLAVEREQMLTALYRAEESRASAELATARAEAARAEAVNAEMRRSTEVLKQEMQRNPGAR